MTAPTNGAGRRRPPIGRAVPSAASTAPASTAAVQQALDHGTADYAMQTVLAAAELRLEQALGHRPATGSMVAARPMTKPRHPGAAAQLRGIRAELVEMMGEAPYKSPEAQADLSSIANRLEHIARTVDAEPGANTASTRKGARHA